jgi:hypothetical protein
MFAEAAVDSHPTSACSRPPDRELFCCRFSFLQRYGLWVVILRNPAAADARYVRRLALNRHIFTSMPVSGLRRERSTITMEINSIHDLQVAENQIRLAIQQHRLEGVLLGLREAADRLEPFTIGGIALFAIRHCTAGHRTQTSQALEWDKLAPLAHLVTQYLLADPLAFDQTLQQEFNKSNPVFSVLRMVSSQMPYHVSLFGRYAQPLVLFREMPKELAGREDIPQFDFDAAFMKINGCSLTDFVSTGFVASAAVHSHQGFTRGYFEKARLLGVSLPEDREILPILDKLAADVKKLKDLFRSYRVSDRRFAAYDFNPLFLYPIVRPWRQKQPVLMDQDRMIAPIPKLIAFRVSTGIFYQMFNCYKTDFSKYFGYLFEAYIGRILENSVTSEELLSEDDIRNTYPEEKGKVPDWVVIDGSTAILVECKATRFSRAAVTTGAEDAIEDSLKQVMKGLRQLHSFREACKTKQPGLETLHICSTFKPVLITLEPLYLVNSEFFRQYIDGELAKEGITDLPWLILAVDELEKLQPHAAAGIGLSRIVEGLEGKPFHMVLEEIQSQTGQTYEGSFLYSTERKLYQRLGFSAKDGSKEV